MTVIAAEAVPAAAGAAEGAAAGGATRGAAAGAAGSIRPSRPAASRQRKGPPRHRAEDTPKNQLRERGHQTLAEARAADISIPHSHYRGIIVAEFVATVVIIGAAPFLTPRKKGETAEESAAKLSLAAPLVRLSAACIVFFILALFSQGPRSGRIAAAFGGLVTLGAFLNASESLSGLNMIFTAQKKKSTTSTATQSGAGEGDLGNAQQFLEGK